MSNKLKLIYVLGAIVGCSIFIVESIFYRGPAPIIANAIGMTFFSIAAYLTIKEHMKSLKKEDKA